MALQSLAQPLELRDPTIHLSQFLPQQMPQAWPGRSATFFVDAAQNVADLPEG
jgi:hypothetical protein